MLLYAFLVDDASMELLTWMNGGVKPSPKRMGGRFIFTKLQMFKFSFNPEITIWIHGDGDGPPVRGSVVFNGRRIPFQILGDWFEKKTPRWCNQSVRRTVSNKRFAGSRQNKPRYN